MRIITLYQPYASLVIAGLKQWETRPRPVRFKERIGIHAAKEIPKWCVEKIISPEFKSALSSLPSLNLDSKNIKTVNGISFPVGCILGTVVLGGCMPTENWKEIRKTHTPDLNTDAEFNFGDYERNRYAWKLKSPVALEIPIAATGKQGWWKYNFGSYVDQLSMFPKAVSKAEYDEAKRRADHINSIDPALWQTFSLAYTLRLNDELEDLQAIIDTYEQNLL